MRNSILRLFSIVGCFILAVGSGCTNNTPAAARGELNNAYSALETQQYDQALARADAFLRHTPAGPGSAEALYLRGRAFEQKPASSQVEASSNLQAARQAYSEALTHQPSRNLEGLIRSGLANVAYFQDDFTTAAVEWTSAYDYLSDNDSKAWVLYRIGVARQRLNQFADADKYFQSVQQRYPESVPAQRAREHLGARSFSVQFASFTASSSADEAVDGLHKDGLAASKKMDARGRNAVIVGPFLTYRQAQALKVRYASKYPDAMILP